MEISDDFAFVTAEAFRLNGLTQGALDVTVGPLVNLWGFGPDKTVTREPTAEQIRQASAVVGTDKIIRYAVRLGELGSLRVSISSESKLVAEDVLRDRKSVV